MSLRMEILYPLPLLYTEDKSSAPLARADMRPHTFIEYVFDVI